MPDDVILTEILDRGEGFGHRQHVEFTWRCLERERPEVAIGAVTGALRQLAAAHGAPEWFHVTITGAWLRCVAVHRERRPASGFDAFIARNPELLDPHLLEHFFSAERLADPEARRAVVAPDRRALPALAA